jgi:translation initiation factor IF-1
MRQKDDCIEGTGILDSEYRGGMYRVKLLPPLSGEILAKLCGKMTKFRVRVLPGDVVSVEVSAYDLTRGRITYRGVRRDRGAA